MRTDMLTQIENGQLKIENAKRSIACALSTIHYPLKSVSAPSRAHNAFRLLVKNSNGEKKSSPVNPNSNKKMNKYRNGTIFVKFATKQEHALNLFYHFNVAISAALLGAVESISNGLTNKQLRCASAPSRAGSTGSSATGGSLTTDSPTERVLVKNTNKGEGLDSANFILNAIKPSKN